jgi:CheY-like chemotaxis protein
MSNNKMLKMLLSKRGISSDQAFNGQEGIDTVQNNGVSAYDLIFMDYTMPIKVYIENLQASSAHVL